MLTIILTVVLLIVLTTQLLKKVLKNEMQQQKDVPGLQKSDPVLGNLPDMFKAGSLLKFLQELHAQFGPIASYWHKDVFTVSLADPKYFKITEKMFDRHPAMFEFALPLISWKSMQYLNGDFGRNRYKFMAQPFGFSGCEKALEKMTNVVKEDIFKWNVHENIPLHEKMLKMAINIITKTNFGCHFQEEKNSEILLKEYEKVITDFDDALLGVWSFGKGDEREEEFHRNVKSFKKEIRRIVEAYIDVRNIGDYDPAPFLDALIDNIDDQDEIIHQAITFMIGGFHTSGTMMTWFFYNLGLHPEIQEKVHQEIREALQGESLKSMEDIERLPYTKQVMNETLRQVKLGLFTERRAEKDVEIGGFLIKEGSQVVNAVCLTLDDKKAFPNPDQFDPENCCETKTKGLAFSPFGFGVRKCPGYRFATAELFVGAVEVLSKYKVVVADKENIVKPVHGFITKPDREVWVELQQHI